MSWKCLRNRNADVEYRICMAKRRIRVEVHLLSKRAWIGTPDSMNTSEMQAWILLLVFQLTYILGQALKPVLQFDAIGMHLQLRHTQANHVLFAVLAEHCIWGCALNGLRHRVNARLP